jgi:hypothetical protein
MITLKYFGFDIQGNREPIIRMSEQGYLVLAKPGEEITMLPAAGSC